MRVLTREDVPEIWKHVEKDALIVIDEAQNFWPTQRQPLKPELTKFVAEHGHDGLDILLMGQCLVDVHPTWRRRVSQKVVFTKMEAVGQANRYQWVAYKASSPEKWHESQKGPLLGEPYDPVVFECYKSHNDGTENKDTYVDPRANLLKGKLFRVGVPGMLVAMALGGWFLWRAFYGGGLVAATTKNAPKSEQATTVAAPAASNPAYQNGQVRGYAQQPQKDWSDRLFERLEGARLVYWRVNREIAKPGLWRQYDYVLDDLLLDVSGNGVRHQINLQALIAAGIEVVYDRSGKSRYLVMKYKDKVVLVSEGISSGNGAMFMGGGTK